MPERDRLDPSVFETIRVDPGSHLDPRTAELVARDLQRWTRRYLKPLLRVGTRAAVFAIVLAKRVLPFQFSSSRTLDRLGVWFLRRLVSPEGVELLLRHFVVESNLVDFVARNSGRDDVALADLRPTRLEHLLDDGVMRHDRNLYNLFLDLGHARGPVRRVPLHRLDFSMLAVPQIEDSSSERKWLRLDLESGLYLMNVAFCLFTSEQEYDRAVNSFQLDESLLGLIADQTGDPVFRTWTPMRFLAWLHLHRDVTRDLVFHAVVNDFAHTRLVHMAQAVRSGQAWSVLEERGPIPADLLAP